MQLMREIAMSANEARKWLILASLIITGIQIAFLFSAPAFGYPLEFSKSLDLLQIVAPVFLGYLGTAVHFIFMSPTPPAVIVNTEFLGYLVKGPIIIYASVMTVAFSAFGYTNRMGAPIGGGMTTDNLATSISISLSVLAITTGVIISYLFTGSRTPTPALDNVPRSPDVVNEPSPAPPKNNT